MPDTSWTPPSLEDIKAYCKEHSLRVDPERFYTYYSRSNFTYRGLPMDWQGQLAKWDKTEYQRRSTSEPYTNGDEDPNQIKKYTPPEGWPAYLKRLQHILDNNLI